MSHFKTILTIGVVGQTGFGDLCFFRTLKDYAYGRHSRSKKPYVSKTRLSSLKWYWNDS